MTLPIPDEARGAFPDTWLRKAVDARLVTSERFLIPDGSIQPASIDLRLGEVAYRLRCSFLPEDQRVEDKLHEYSMESIDLRDGAILEKNRPYLIPLIEEVRLPDDISGKANPRSSTGRVDVFTRVITDKSHTFDAIPHGYWGRLYLEVVSRSFTIKVQSELSLNQLRLSRGTSRVADDEVLEFHRESPILFRADGQPVSPADVRLSDGLYLSLDLAGDADGVVGYKAKRNSKLLDLSALDAHEWRDFWEPVVREPGNRIILEPEEFYLLLSAERVRIPPEFAAEMTAYDPTSGELRTHYAGFFDPGFGHSVGGVFHGSRAALEVRAHDVPFMVESGQKVCKLSFERMLEPPTTLYGGAIGSSYQYQEGTLSKHFRREPPLDPSQLSLLP